MSTADSISMARLAEKIRAMVVDMNDDGLYLSDVEERLEELLARTKVLISDVGGNEKIL